TPPPPPHVCGAVHVPQTSVPPHPSGMEPQFLPWALHVVGVQVSGLLMNRVWLTQLRPTHAESTAAESTAGTLVVMGKLAVVVVAGTVTLGGAPVPLSLTTRPPAGAGPESVTVPVAGLPPTTGFGLKVRLLGTGGGVAHTPATPPPPQICGSAQVPQPSHPPQPSGSAPHVLPWAAQVVGVHPPPQTLALPLPPHAPG